LPQRSGEQEWTVRDVRNSWIVVVSKISLPMFWLEVVDVVEYMLLQIEIEVGIYLSGSGFTATVS
jgi:hypothetical protein